RRQTGAALVANGATGLRQSPSAGGEPPRRGGKRFHLCDAIARQWPAWHRGSGDRYRRGGAATLVALRGGAPAVRQTDQGVPGDSIQARRHRDARQCWPGAPPRRGDGEGSRREREAVQRDGEVVRQRDGDGGDVRGHPDLRWLWIREGLPCRTALSGRKGYGDLRGYVRDSANCHCQRVVLAWRVNQLALPHSR